MSTGRAGAGADERFMRRALALAQRAQGRTSPNPMVGALIVKQGRIVGHGYHPFAGAPHAEPQALARAGKNARGATLYVTLEPCNHHGRTPPCCDVILESGIARIVVAVRDPHPLVSGRGIRRLRRAGIRVTESVLEREARELNAPFWKAVKTGLPLVTAKVAQSLDGKIATRTGASRWISSAESRRFAHGLRARTDAILAGINTVLADDPLLSARGAGARKAGPPRPIKIILDRRLRLRPSARCLSAASPAPTWVVTTARRPSTANALARRGAEVLVFPASRGRVPLERLFRLLVRRGVHSVLIEGGGEVLAGALRERLVDRVVWFIAPLLIGGSRAPGAIGGEGIRRLSEAIQLEGVRVSRISRDLCVEATVRYPGGHVHRHSA